MSNSTDPIGDHPLDDLAARALDALDDAERQAVDDHLARCEVCRAELAGYHETLATLIPDEVPPAAVWQRIADDIRAPGRPAPRFAGQAVDDEVSPIASLAEAQAAQVRARQPFRLRWLAAAACLVAVAAAAGAFGFALGDADDDADIASLAEQASDDPDGVLATLADTGGRPVARVVADDDGAFILLEGLENLPEGRAYQLWSFDGPQPVSLGMLGREGTNTVAFRLPPTITELAISVAPTSGDPAPNGQIQASGSVARS